MVKPLYQKGWRVFNFHFSLQYAKLEKEENKWQIMKMEMFMVE